MNYLVLDTSGKNLTVIIKNGQKVYSHFDEDCGVKHSVSLMPSVEELAKKANLDLSNVDFFGVVVGPGSFTGIRIGVSTIKALAFAFNKPCLSLTSFDTLSYNVIENGKKALSLIDASHGAYYTCGYLGKQVILPPCYMLKEQIKEILGDYDIVVCDKQSDIGNVASVLDGLKIAIEQNLDKLSYNLDEIVPLYVRKSQAEEGRK